MFQVSVVVTDIRPPSGGFREIHFAQSPQGVVSAIAPFVFSTSDPEILGSIGVGTKLVLTLSEDEPIIVEPVEPTEDPIVSDE